MNFTESVSSFFSKYAVFKGRSSRSEYWYAVLFCAIVGFGAGFFEGLFALPPSISLLFQLAVIVPSFAIIARSLHDTNKSGWWYLLVFTIVGIIPVLYWFCKAGDEADNEYGSNPLNNSA